MSELRCGRTTVAELRGPFCSCSHPRGAPPLWTDPAASAAAIGAATGVSVAAAAPALALEPSTALAMAYAEAAKQHADQQALATRLVRCTPARFCKPTCFFQPTCLQVSFVFCILPQAPLQALCSRSLAAC